MRCLLDSIPDNNSPKNIRDKAIIALGFAGVFRHSELCAIDGEHMTCTVDSEAYSGESWINEPDRPQVNARVAGILHARSAAFVLLPERLSDNREERGAAFDAGLS